jgi:glycosyltransferase involved in cell wall biosynthesis
LSDICIVLEGTWPYLTGGVAGWLDQLLAGLDGMTVDVVHLRDGAVPLPEPAYDAALCARLLVESVDRDPTEMAARLPAAAVYHALSTGPASDVAAAAARRNGAGLVITEHGLAWKEAVHGVGEVVCGRVPPAERKPWVDRLRAAATRAYAAADVVTTVCSANAREQVGLGAIDPVVVPNPAPPVGPPRLGPASPARVGFVGRVVPIKDVATFVRAAEILRRRDLRTRFVAAGPLDHDPEYAAEQRRRSRGLVEFPGEVDAGALLRQLDVLVLPSISEAQPLAVLEAMAAGTPVVATAVGGVPELLADGRGLLVEPGRPGDVADAVERLLTDTDLWRSCSRAGQAHVVSHHQYAHLIQAYRRIYARWV